MSEHLCANSEQVFSRLDSELIAPWYSITLYIHPDTIDMLRRDGISRALFLQEMHMWPWVFFARLPTGDIRLDASRPDHRVLMVPRVHAKRYPGELVVAVRDSGLHRFARMPAARTPRLPAPTQTCPSALKACMHATPYTPQSCDLACLSTAAIRSGVMPCVSASVSSPLSCSQPA
jgi:hypothetical protein